MNRIKRKGGRASNELRPVFFERNYTRYAEGSVLSVLGETRVLCTATIDDKVPSFLKGTGKGWITAEYAMLPRATEKRTPRMSSVSGINGRSAEIQRLIGRSLRSAVDLSLLGARTITVDCDVLQADGGTRVAAINGSFIAVVDALDVLGNPLLLKGWVSAVSVGKLNDSLLLDLDAEEDRSVTVDFNAVMNQQDEFIEIQGTGEQGCFSRTEAAQILDLCANGCSLIRRIQMDTLNFSEEEKKNRVF